LHNRRHFMEQLQMEIRRGARIRHQFTVILLDVDHFKNFNDTNGHPEGDELLQRLAALLQINLRSTDVVARYGGEEFVILLLDTGIEEGHATALKLQQAVAAQPFPHEEHQPGERLTISVGVSFYPHDSRDGRKLVQYADEALYRSKELGRNRVTRYDELRTEIEQPALRSM
ncbi:MAG: diguanylate cyclase, partial [Myxococcota bacterium]